MFQGVQFFFFFFQQFLSPLDVERYENRGQSNDQQYNDEQHLFPLLGDGQAEVSLFQYPFGLILFGNHFLPVEEVLKHPVGEEGDIFYKELISGNILHQGVLNEVVIAQRQVLVDVRQVGVLALLHVVSRRIHLVKIQVIPAQGAVRECGVLIVCCKIAAENFALDVDCPAVLAEVAENVRIVS